MLNPRMKNLNLIMENVMVHVKHMNGGGIGPLTSYKEPSLKHECHTNKKKKTEKRERKENVSYES